MNTSDKTRFAHLLGLLAETFHKPLSHAQLEAFWIATNNLTLQQLETATLHLLKSSKFMPTPADIREAAQPLPSPLEAAAAWESIINRFRNPQASQPSNLALRTLKLIGGWNTLGNRSPEENDTWSRKEFLRLYEELASSPSHSQNLLLDNPKTPNLAKHLTDSILSRLDTRIPT